MYVYMYIYNHFSRSCNLSYISNTQLLMLIHLSTRLHKNHCIKIEIPYVPSMRFALTTTYRYIARITKVYLVFERDSNVLLNR